MTMQMNQISGEFPVELRNLPQLCRVRLDSNQMSGTLGDMVGLDSLDSFFGKHLRWLPAADELSAGVAVMTNRFSGSLPEFNFGNLKNLFVSFNAISGSIGQSRRDAPAAPVLESFSCAYNRLSGDCTEQTKQSSLWIESEFVFRHVELSGQFRIHEELSDIVD